MTIEDYIQSINKRFLLGNGGLATGETATGRLAIEAPTMPANQYNLFDDCDTLYYRRCAKCLV